MSELVSVSIFAYGSYVGETDALHFSTNGDKPAIQNGSVAAFCPFCGEVWLRAVHAHGFPFWRVVPVACHQHAAETTRFSPIWFNLAAVFRIYPDTSPEVLKLELDWWAQKLNSWAEEI
jgi:hypothetical protein